MNLQELTSKMNYKVRHSIPLFILGVIMLGANIYFKQGFLTAIVPGFLIAANFKHIISLIKSK